MAVHVPALPRTDVWHGRYGSVLAMLAVLLPFALVLIWAALQATSSQVSVADDIRATAALVDDHAAVMDRVGDRIAAAAATSSAADRETWRAHGQHMISDGASLRSLAARLRGMVAAIGSDPLHSGASLIGGTSGDTLAAYAAVWRDLRADALSAAIHGRAMLQMASDLEPGVARGMLAADDVSQLRAASSGVVAAGDGVARIGDAQLSSIDQMQRGMGR